MRQRKHPHRHHDRKIERRDAGGNAQRLAQAPVVDAAADIVRMHAGQQPRHAAGEFHDLDAARDFAIRVGQHLAVFPRDNRGQVAAPCLQQFAETEQDAGAPQWRSLGPRRECRRRPPATALSTRAASANGTRAGFLPRGRIEYAADATARLARHLPAIDEVTHRHVQPVTA